MSDQSSAPTSPTQVLHRIIELLNAGEFEAAEQLIAPDAVNHAAPPGAEPGRASFRQGWEALWTGFPDWEFTIEDSVESGDLVANRYTNRGTNKGDFMGNPATGRAITVLGLDLVRVRDGHVVEHWALLDQADIAAQLDADA